MSAGKETTGGLAELKNSFVGILRNLKNAVFRHGIPGSPRANSQAVFGNLFLHIHPVRTHRWTLRKSFTMGLGIASTVLFGILAVTGLILMVYYKPSVEHAYNSVKDIHYVVPGGRIIRNLHRWSAHLLVVCVLLHMVRVLATGSYRKPREFNWLGSVC